MYVCMLAVLGWGHCWGDRYSKGSLSLSWEAGGPGLLDTMTEGGTGKHLTL